VRWVINEGQLRYELLLPPNTDARLTLPTLQPSSTRINGEPLVEGIEIDRIEKDVTTVSMQLASGTYSIMTKAPLSVLSST
jgi:hypothetical protein